MNRSISRIRKIPVSVVFRYRLSLQLNILRSQSHRTKSARRNISHLTKQAYTPPPSQIINRQQTSLTFAKSTQAVSLFVHFNAVVCGVYIKPCHLTSHQPPPPLIKGKRARVCFSNGVCNYQRTETNPLLRNNGTRYVRGGGSGCEIFMDMKNYRNSK